MFAKLAAFPKHNAATQSLIRSTCRAMHYKLPWEKEHGNIPETAVIPDHIGWVTINDGTWRAEIARQAPCVPFTVGSWWAIDSGDTEMDDNGDDEEQEDPNQMNLMNRNSRFGKKANGGKRACSRQRRRAKRRAFGNHRR